MKKFKNCIGSSALMFLFFSFLMIGVSATNFEVGVKVGDWAKYEYTFDYKVEPPQQSLPPEFEKAKQISHSLVVVKEVFDTTSLKLQETIFYQNGSQKINFLVGDVKTGGGNLSIQVIARNLSVGDKISMASDVPSINETKRVYYAGAMRNVNRACRIEFSLFGDNYTMVDLYWDKETGILCEVIISSYMTTLSGGKIITIIKCVIVDTNLWKNRASEEWVTHAIFVIIFGGCIFYILKKTLRRRFKTRHPRRPLGSRVSNERRFRLRMGAFKA